MKLNTEELTELQHYLDAFRPDVKFGFRKEDSRILEFDKYGLLLYKAKAKVMREDPKDIKEEVVYFLETHAQSVRKHTEFHDICLALVIFMAAEEVRVGFDLTRQEWLKTHPQPKKLNPNETNRNLN